MTTTGTYTCQEICDDALHKARITAIDEAADADTMQVARRQLNRMLKAWQNNGPSLANYSKQTVTATTSAAHTMDPVRPLEIVNVNFNNGSTELPMQELTRLEYEELPVKTTAGTPTCYFYDKQREAARLYVWPVLASVSSETFEVTYIREYEDVELTDAVDVPGEYYDCVVYNLAARLSDDYNRDNMPVRTMALALYQEALSFDRQGSVYFLGDDYA